MDRLIKRFDASADEDLMLCVDRGIAYQRNMGRGRIKYDHAYIQHYRSYAGSAVEQALNAGRMALLQQYAPAGARVVDVGVGSGAFVQCARAAGYRACGTDINPEAVAWLRERGWLCEKDDELTEADVVTMWDSLEHIEDPDALLERVGAGKYLFVATPIMESLAVVRASKHYKPGEHLYYWTERGLCDWLALYGFRLVQPSDHEITAGRVAIGAYVFRRDLPGYREFISEYQELHSMRHYGDSATELHLETVASIVRANHPRSILDFGCGRSDLSSHFWLDGRRRIARYDPAIPQWRKLPEEKFDLVLCCDVLEHIPMAYVDKVLHQVRSKGGRAFFTISLKPARAKLPSGTNAHVTLLTESEWTRWLVEYFGKLTLLPAKPKEMAVLAGELRAASKYRACQCGGEVLLDSYNPIKRPVEWFMRCRDCGGLSDTCKTELEAEQRWSALPITRQPTKERAK